MNPSSSGVARLLGYAGIIPFVIPALLLLTGSTHAALANAIAASYALAILCFLCGSWWGMAQASTRRATLLLSNAYLLLALSLYLFTPEWWALAAALLLAGAWLCEQNASLFPAYPAEYRRLRAILTLCASASMTVVHLYG
jgi:hypothetical protein